MSPATLELDTVTVPDRPILPAPTSGLPNDRPTAGSRPARHAARVDHLQRRGIRIRGPLQAPRPEDRLQIAGFRVIDTAAEGGDAIGQAAHRRGMLTRDGERGASDDGAQGDRINSMMLDSQSNDSKA